MKRQAAANRYAEAAAPLYAGHRAHTTAAILEVAPRPGGRLCLLGAGNCQDVDLCALAAVFREIHLVDLDETALQRALRRQTPMVQARLHGHAPLDVSGVLAFLDHWRSVPPTLAQLDRLVDPAVAATVAALPGPFDVVVSCCLATQMSLHQAYALGDGHPALVDVRRRVMNIHLRTLAALRARDGQVLFLSDLVSTDTYPLDSLPPDADLQSLSKELARDGNFFPGADPILHALILRRDPVLARTLGRSRPLTPWLWRGSQHRTYLVHALALSAAPSSLELAGDAASPLVKGGSGEDEGSAAGRAEEPGKRSRTAT